jgi:hypothetical protein
MHNGHFRDKMCINDEFWLWTQDLSSRCHVKHTHTWWLRPPTSSLEELDLFSFIWVFRPLILILWGNTWSWLLNLHLAILKCVPTHSDMISKLKPASYPINMLLLQHIFPHTLNLAFWEKWAGDSGQSEDCRGVVTASVLIGELSCEAITMRWSLGRVSSGTRDTSLPRFAPSMEGKTYSC